MFRVIRQYLVLHEDHMVAALLHNVPFSGVQDCKIESVPVGWAFGKNIVFDLLKIYNMISVFADQEDSSALRSWWSNLIQCGSKYNP